MSKIDSSTYQELLALLHYNPDTGIFTRLRDAGNQKKGARAGNVDVEGYRRIKHKGKAYKEHRLAWLFVYGVWPKQQIDHINGIRSDNRLSNLREATLRENHQNRRSNYNSTSKYLGVSYCTRHRKYKVGITVNKQKVHLGYFLSEKEAYAAYCKAKKQLHPFNPTPSH